VRSLLVQAGKIKERKKKVAEDMAAMTGDMAAKMDPQSSDLVTEL
jgi:hypothetical protein